LETTELEGRKRLGLGPHLGSLSEMGGVSLGDGGVARGPTRTPTEGPGGLPLTSSFHTHLCVKYDTGSTARPNRPDQEIHRPAAPAGTPPIPVRIGKRPGIPCFPPVSRFRRIGKRGAPVSRKKKGNPGESESGTAPTLDSEYTQPRVLVSCRGHQCSHRQHAAPIQGPRP
jgi:hypothetical protein